MVLDVSAISLMKVVERAGLGKLVDCLIDWRGVESTAVFLVSREEGRGMARVGGQRYRPSASVPKRYTPAPLF